MRFQNLKFRTKLSLLIGLFVIGLAASFGFSYVMVRKVQVNGPIYKSIVQGKDVIADVLPPPEYIIESYLLVLQMEGENDSFQLWQLVERFKALEAEYNKRHEFWLKDLAEGTLKDALTARSYTPAREFYKLVNEQFFPAVTASDRAKMTTLARGSLRQKYEEHRREIDQVVKLATDRNTSDEETARSTITSWMTFLIGLTGAILALVVVLGWWVARSIVRPTGLLMARVREIAEGAGDLTARVQINTDDEIGRLAHYINQVIQHTHDLIAEVKGASLQLVATSTEIGATAQEQEATMSSFGVSTSQIAAAVKEISATSEELQGTMDEVSRGAHNAVEVANTGRSCLVEMELTIKGLNEATGSITGKLNTIREKANDITSVVTTITKVADHINLLSINAAIEAEKAGEYGRGFLVVAREIRRLADQTAVATMDIESMVRHMQSAVSTGVMEMDKFNQEVRGGASRVSEINSQMGLVIEGVHSLNDRFAPVNEGMRSQSLGAKQINDAMVQLQSGASQTTASLSEFKQATGNLREAANRLRQSVVRFTVEAKGPA